MTTDKDSSKLVMAAEELVKAACSHVESTSLSTANESLQTLKSLGSKLNTLNESISGLKEDVVTVEYLDSKMNTLNQSISGLKDALVKMNKDQTLAWALSNTALGSFQFYEKGKYHRIDSSTWVKEVLSSFRRGSGYYIYDRSTTEYSSYTDNSEGEKKFREALKTQVHTLIGKEPVIKVADNGYAIYYS